MSALFDIPTLSPTEDSILQELYSNPIVKKHLRIMVLKETEDLIRLSSISQPDSVLVKAHAQTQGKLSVLNTLLSIEAPKPKE